MYECSKCHTEFEGKFCPECGTKREDKKFCPECGAQLAPAVKFCPECGASVTGAAAQEKSPSAKKTESPAEEQTATAPAETQAAPADKKAGGGALFEKFHIALRYVPSGLFALFTLLMLAFMAAPIAKAEAFGMSETYGSIYKGAEDIPGIEGCRIAIILFFLVSAALTAFMACSLFAAKFKKKVIGFGGKFYLPLGEFLSYAAFALYFIFLVIAAVMMSKVKAFDEGMGFIKAGSGPQVIIAFAVIFAVFAVGAMVGDWFIGKKFPEIVAADKAERAENIAAKKEADALAAENKAKAAAAQSSAASAEPAAPAEGSDDDTPIKFGGKPVLSKVNTYVRIRRVLMGIGVPLLITSVSGFSLITLGLTGIIEKQMLFYVGVGAFGLCALIGILCAVVPVKHWMPTGLRKEAHQRGGDRSPVSIYVTGLVFNLLDLIACIVVKLKVSDVSLVAIPVILMFAILALANVAGLIGCGVYMSRRKELCLHFYGVPKAYEDNRQIVKFNPEKEATLYAAYKQNKSAAANYASSSVKTSVHAVNAVIAVIVAIAAFAFLMVYNFALTPFSAKYVSYITRDNDIYDVESFLGKADYKEDEYDQERVLIYGEYGKIMKRMAEIEEEVEDATMLGDMSKLASLAAEAAKLQEKAMTMTSKALIIEFDKDGDLESVMLDTKLSFADDFDFDDDSDFNIYSKNVKSVKLDSDVQFLRGARYYEDVYARYFYTDGSYKYERVPSSAFADIDHTKTGSQSIEWDDEWGYYKTSIKLVDSISGEYRDVRYVLTEDKANGGLKLKISGSGYINDYGDAPWTKYAGSVTELIIDGNITSYYNNGEYRYPRLKVLVLGKNTSVGSYSILDSEQRDTVKVFYDRDYNPGSDTRYDNTYFAGEWEYVDGEPVAKAIDLTGIWVMQSTYNNNVYLQFNDDGSIVAREYNGNYYYEYNGTYVVGDRRITIYYEFGGSMTFDLVSLNEIRSEDDEVLTRADITVFPSGEKVDVG